MKYLNINNILCLSPHTDDIEISCSGTILKYYDTDFDILCLSNGSKHDPSSKKDRFSEVKTFWDNVDNVVVHSAGIKYISDLNEESILNIIENDFLYKKKYDAIFCPPKEDTHFEHQIINSVAYSLTRNSKISLFNYFTPSTKNDWTPNIYIDINSYIDKKINLLKHFQSQQKNKYFREEIIKAFHSDIFTIKNNLQYVEKYKAIFYYK